MAGYWAPPVPPPGAVPGAYYDPYYDPYRNGLAPHPPPVNRLNRSRSHGATPRPEIINIYNEPPSPRGRSPARMAADGLHPHHHHHHHHGHPDDIIRIESPSRSRSRSRNRDLLDELDRLRIMQDIEAIRNGGGSNNNNNKRHSPDKAAEEEEIIRKYEIKQAKRKADQAEAERRAIEEHERKEAGKKREKEEWAARLKREEEERKAKAKAEMEEWKRRIREEEESKKAAEREKEEEIEREMRERLRRFHFSDQEIDVLIKKELGKRSEVVSTTAVVGTDLVRVGRAPVFPMIHRKFLEIATLRSFGIPWEYDERDSDYIIIMQELNKSETAELFEHTRTLRAREKPERLVIEDSGRKTRRNEKGQMAFVRRHRSKSGGARERVSTGRIVEVRQR